MKAYDLDFLKGMPDRMENVLKEKVYTSFVPLKTTAYMTKEPVPFAERMSGVCKEMAIGDKWGDSMDCAWFNFKGSVPKAFCSKHVVLMLDVNGEGCLFDNGGTPVQGITSKSCYYEPFLGVAVKRVVQFSLSAKGGEEIDVWADCGNNDLFGNCFPFETKTGLKQADIAVCNDKIRDLYYDFYVLNDLRKSLPDDSPRYCSILYALVYAERVLGNFEEENIDKAKKILARELAKKGGTPSLKISAIGHSHLDLAWLWPIRESKRKAARTFATAATFLESYPDYVFGASQPQQFKWIKDEHPALFSRLKKHVESGRLEPLGCMWVEPDTNITGGESLIRQVLYGKKFFKEEFGKEIDVLWLPDVFGFSAVLPQIMAKSGIKYMVTTKINWSRKYSDFPYHTFKWKGNTDDELLVHMPPEATYNSSAAPRGVNLAQKNYIEKGKVEDALMLFGIGDGGGGPGTMHLECLKRMKNLDGLPPVEQVTSEIFFKNLEKSRDVIDTFKGELYLESHQGTYTTEGFNKFYNRLMEALLKTAEQVLSIDAINSGKEYPQQELETIWQEVLLYQFHDILPGSSITRVYDECKQRYPLLEKSTQNLVNSVINRKEVNAVYNSLGYEVEDFVFARGKWQKVKAAPIGYTLLDGKEVGGFNVKVSGNVLENDKLRVEFRDDGSVKFIGLRGSKRNSLSVSGGNVLSVYKDEGDAWDMNAQYFKQDYETFKLISSKSYIEGAVAVREQIFTYGNSTLTQRVKLKEGSSFVEFDNTVDWKESSKMLRADFNTDIVTDEVKCDIQFGSIKRSTKSGFAQEAVQYEICAHKFVELTEGNYSFALLNNCKYGHRVKDGKISLNLLRSPHYPDQTADVGMHSIKYGVYIAEGNSEVEKQAAIFNNDLIPAFAENNFSLVKTDKENIVAETLKLSEDKCGFILRVYENQGSRATCEIALNEKIKKVHLTDLTENVIKELKLNKNGTVKLDFKAFEIHSLKLEI